MLKNVRIHSIVKVHERRTGVKTETTENIVRQWGPGNQENAL